MQKQLPTHKSSSSRTSRRYEQPTIASKSRSPSPYTNRRMCELSEDSRQRLAHLSLGPYTFKKETCCKPPFVVRHVETIPSPDASALSCSARSQRSDDSFRLPPDTSDDPRRRDIGDSRKMHIDDLQMSLDNVNNRRLQESPRRTTSLLSRSAPPSILRHPPSPVLDRSSFRERFQNDHRSSASWRETHERVKTILRTHSVRQKRHVDKNVSWKEHDSCAAVEAELLSSGDLQDSLPFPRDKSVHLDNGEFWSNRAAAFKGKSHRIVFEESMEKIYKNMYRNAVSPHAYRRSLHPKELI